MFRFGGFKTTFRLSKKKREAKNVGEPVCGAYRVNREEFLSNGVDISKRNTSPTVQMTYTKPTLVQSKSSHELTNIPDPPANMSRSMPDIAQPTPAPRADKNKREQRRLEKKQLAEQKKRDKLAAQEQQRQEKLRREREKQEKIQQEKYGRNKLKKRAAPQPQLGSTTTPLDQSTPIPQAPPKYSTNTLESSISRSSGPPPYTADLVPNQRDNSGNTSFSTPPEDVDSWDIISQHREQLNRPKATSGSAKQTHMDLHYNYMGSQNRDKDNSEA